MEVSVHVGEDLEKATVIPRAKKGGTGEYRGGRFIPKALWEAERVSAQKALPKLCSDLSEDVEFCIRVAELIGQVPKGIPIKLTLESAEDKLIRTLRKAYAEAMTLGKRSSGNFTDLTKEEKTQLSKIRRDEYSFARKFLRAAHEGKGRVDYSIRASMYGNALKEAFWLGFVLGNTDPRRRIQWQLGETDHCTHCVNYGSHAPYTLQEFIDEVLSNGHLPRSGNLECKGIRCGCELKETWDTPG